ncbi:MAG: hypothetical protein OXM88_16530 [bacterium]|nr:hypothetical protein [bacterium]
MTNVEIREARRTWLDQALPVTPHRDLELLAFFVLDNLTLDAV